jgi:pimeloyl-ACP methyl ester carboxylesterase
MAGSDPTRSIMKLQGIDLPVARKGKGPQLLILHGGGGPVSHLPFADRLAERFEIIEPVHPGFAGTKFPDRFDHLTDLIFLYLDLMDALDLEGATVMGMSMGGWTAAEIAVMTTARMSRLILVDAVGVKVGGRDDRDICDVFATPAPEVARRMWHDLARAPDPSKMSEQELEILASNRIALAQYTWDPYMHNPKLKHRLHRIKVPTLVVWGASDGIVTPRYGEAYAKMIPGARFVVIPEAGHAPYIEQPAAFARQVMAFTE